MQNFLKMALVQRTGSSKGVGGIPRDPTDRLAVPRWLLWDPVASLKSFCCSQYMECGHQ